MRLERVAVMVREAPGASTSRHGGRCMTELNFATLSGDYAFISKAAVEDFRSSLHGVTLRTGDEGYDSARRIWNAMIDKRPALIARCSGTADVINSVNFARGERPTDFGAWRRP